jgi:hypothetical protein
MLSGVIDLQEDLLHSSGVIGLQEDPLHSSDVINSTFASPIQSSIVKQIHHKKSSESTVRVFFSQIISEKYLFACMSS